ncbi:DUF2634 domain-containing protein [Marinisporobacter balticus]|uniref:Uncharacterized protein DUF2634 n=1 Tax=Marinisporobacter balticus TaxID=2018667 RepID=A0A4R2KS67_9FIRM|nr:DUF2634 domain-containing protein [Marinisporobacter balticus]TCO69495.1 uncharacterized protein DUF2634 [Marinisporobacter balticus]
MFPDIANTEIDTQKSAETTNLGKSFLFDFDKGDFILQDGRLVNVEDIEALKVWIEKVLRTEKFRFEIYKNVDYGVALEDLIGQTLPRQFVESELKREIRESVIKHPMVSDISNLIAEQDGSKLKISFKVNLVDGNTVNTEVNI